MATVPSRYGRAAAAAGNAIGGPAVTPVATTGVVSGAAAAGLLTGRRLLGAGGDADQGRQAQTCDSTCYVRFTLSGPVTMMRGKISPARRRPNTFPVASCGRRGRLLPCRMRATATIIRSGGGFIALLARWPSVRSRSEPSPAAAPRRWTCGSARTRRRPLTSTRRCARCARRRHRRSRWRRRQRWRRAAHGHRGHHGHGGGDGGQAAAGRDGPAAENTGGASAGGARGHSVQTSACKRWTKTQF